MTPFTLKDSRIPQDGFEISLRQIFQSQQMFHGTGNLGTISPKDII
jgi:hypothetical protein